jgi:hypothetical protein
VQSATTIAAAAGSETLAVVSGHAIHLLRVVDGAAAATADSPVELGPRAKRVEGPVIAGGALYVVADGSLLRFASASTSSNVSTR